MLGFQKKIGRWVVDGRKEGSFRGWEGGENEFKYPIGKSISCMQAAADANLVCFYHFRHIVLLIAQA